MMRTPRSNVLNRRSLCYSLVFIIPLLIGYRYYNHSYYLQPQPILNHLDHPFKNQMSTQTSKKTATVIFSHGLGDSSAGWSFLIDQLGPKMPWVKWFDILGLDPSAPEDEKGLMKSVETIRSFIRNEVESGISTQRIIVGGFSQGATISLLTGLTNPDPLAGVISLSGFLPLRNKLKELQSTQAKRLPIFWGHGMDDSVVPYKWGSLSVDFLKEQLNMTDVEFKSYPGLVHSASPQELRDMTNWLLSKIPDQS